MLEWDGKGMKWMCASECVCPEWAGLEEVRCLFMSAYEVLASADTHTQYWIVLGCKSHGDYATRHQREASSSGFLKISQVVGYDEGAPLVF